MTTSAPDASSARLLIFAGLARPVADTSEQKLPRHSRCVSTSVTWECRSKRNGDPAYTLLPKPLLTSRAAQLEVQSGAAHLISNIYSRPERIGLRVVRTALNRSRTSATQQPQLKQPWPRQEARTCWRCGRSRKRRRTSTMRCNQVRRTCATPHSPLPPARFATWRHCARARARPRALVHMLPRERWCAWLRRADASASVLLRTRGHPRRTLARCGAGAMAVCLTPSLCRTASPEQRSPRW